MDVKLPRDFKEFLQSLNSNNVEYLLIGGYAVGYHGYPRVTNDIDVWVRVSEDNANRLMQALTGFGFRTPELKQELFLEVGKIIRMGRPPLRIEIATGISGVTFDTCFEARESTTLDGVSVPVISRRHLLANKRAAGRPKDLADLDVLDRRRPPRRAKT